MNSFNDNNNLNDKINDFKLINNLNKCFLAFSRAANYLTSDLVAQLKEETKEKLKEDNYVILFFSNYNFIFNSAGATFYV